MSPKISVITPTFNHEHFIRPCIESVRDQTYRDWEMIITDDHSSDKNSKIIDTYVKKDTRIKALYHDKTWGIRNLDKTYNELLSKAKGEYIAILEGDDYWPQEYLSKQADVVEKKKPVLSFSNWVVVDKNNNWIYARFYPELEKLIPRDRVWEDLSDLSFSILPSATIIKRSMLEKVGGFRRGNVYPFVDIPTFLRLALEGDFAYCHQTYSYYRKHADSSWFSIAQDKEATLREEVQKELLIFYEKHKHTFKQKHIPINVGQIIESQQKYLYNKRKSKMHNLLFHYFIFGDVSAISTIGKKNQNVRLRLLSGILLLPGLKKSISYFLKCVVFLRIKSTHLM